MVTARTRMLRLAIVLTCACGVIGGAAAQALPQPATFRLASPGYLTVATNGTIIPGIIVGPGDNDLGGLEGALFNAFARDHGLKLKLFQTTFASVILSVQQGKTDVGPYVFYTAERAKVLYYTFPFLVSHAVIYTSKAFQYVGPESMNGKKVATVVGFVWAPYLQKWSSSGATLFQDQTTAGQALLNGQIDGYVNGEFVVHAPPLSDSPSLVAHALHVGDFGIPDSLLANTAYNVVNCNNRGLAAALDRELLHLHATGEWRNILKANGLGPEADVPLRTPPQVCAGR